MCHLTLQSWLPWETVLLLLQQNLCLKRTKGELWWPRGTRIGFTFLGGFNISHQAQGAALIPTTSLAEVTEGKRICISNLDCEQVKIGDPKATVNTVSAPVSTAENSGGGFGESHMAPYWQTWTISFKCPPITSKIHTSSFFHKMEVFSAMQWSPRLDIVTDRRTNVQLPLCFPIRYSFSYVRLFII